MSAPLSIPSQESVRAEDSFTSAVYTAYMGVGYTSIRVTERAYEALKSKKEEGESFSETIERLADERSFTELAGIFSEDTVADIEDIIDERNSRYAERRKRTFEQSE
jgi:predicted CopG family antitoxin